MLPENTPDFDKETGVVTLPAVEGVTWIVDGKQHRAGKVAAVKPGKSVHVTVKTERGFRVRGDREWTFTRQEKSD
jgi:hypothetical protein